MLVRQLVTFLKFRILFFIFCVIAMRTGKSLPEELVLAAIHMTKDCSLNYEFIT